MITTVRRIGVNDAARLRQGSLVLASVVAVALVTLSAIGESVRPVNAGLVLLLFTLAVAASYGIWAGLIAAIAANLAMTYFFLDPIHRFWASDPQHLGALGVFLLVSLIGSSLLEVSRRLAEEARRGQAEAESLLRLNRAMIGQYDPLSALKAICTEAASAFDVSFAEVWTRKAEEWTLVASSLSPADQRPLTDSERASAAHLSGQSETVQLEQGSGWLLATVSLFPGQIAILRLTFDLDRRLEATDLVKAFAGEAGLAQHRLELAAAASQAEVLRRSDEVKTAILSSIAHDLKTPLATIKTSMSSLLDGEVDWSEADRREFLLSVNDEADRLNRTISALLDLNRIESGTVRPLLHSVSLSQLAEEALSSSDLLGGRQISVDVPEIEVYTDGSLIRHALVNLLENAAAYSPPEGSIRVTGSITAEEAQIAVEDDGPGVALEDRPYVFQRFFRGRNGRASQGHSGLGLAIVHGFVTLCGGRVTLADLPRSSFVIHLPLTAPAESS